MDVGKWCVQESSPHFYFFVQLLIPFTKLNSNRTLKLVPFNCLKKSQLSFEQANQLVVRSMVHGMV